MPDFIILIIVIALTAWTTFFLTARHYQRIVTTLRGETYVKADKAFMNGWDAGAHFVLTSQPDSIKAMQEQMTKD